MTGRWLQILLRTWLQDPLRTEIDVEVFEVFSCEASEEAKVVVACDVCNVADQAALRILLRLKASIGNGFQLSVTL